MDPGKITASRLTIWGKMGRATMLLTQRDPEAKALGPKAGREEALRCLHEAIDLLAEVTNEVEDEEEE